MNFVVDHDEPPDHSNAASSESRAAAITALRQVVEDYERSVASSRPQNSWRDDLFPWRKASHLGMGLGLFRAIQAAERADDEPAHRA